MANGDAKQNSAGVGSQAELDSFGTKSSPPFATLGDARTPVRENLKLASFDDPPDPRDPSPEKKRRHLAERRMVVGLFAPTSAPSKPCGAAPNTVTRPSYTPSDLFELGGEIGHS